MAKILDVKGRQVWDSRGRPTVEAEVIVGRGTHAARHRARDRARRRLDRLGRGEERSSARKAVQNIQHAHPRRPARAQRLRPGEDRRAPDRARRHARTRAASAPTPWSRFRSPARTPTRRSQKMPLWKKLAGERRVALPVPQIQIFGGGAHARGRCDVQDYMVDLHRRGQLRRGAGMDRAGLRRGRQAPREARRAARRRRRGRLLAGVQVERGRRSPSWSARSRTPASSPAPTSAIALDIAATPALPRRQLPPRAREPRALGRAAARHAAALDRALPDRLDRGSVRRDRRRRDARLYQGRRRSRSSATTSSSPMQRESKRPTAPATRCCSSPTRSAP